MQKKKLQQSGAMTENSIVALIHSAIIQNIALVGRSGNLNHIMLFKTEVLKLPLRMCNFKNIHAK